MIHGGDSRAARAPLGGDTARDLSPDCDPEETAAVRLVAEALRETLDAEHTTGNQGATCAAIGERCGVPRQRVSEWMNPLSGRTPKVEKAARMGPRIAPRFFRRLAAKIEAQHGAGDLRDATLDVHDATGRLSQRVREALADGVITPEEEARIEAEILESEARLTATRAALRAACARRGGR